MSILLMCLPDGLRFCELYAPREILRYVPSSSRIDVDTPILYLCRISNTFKLGIRLGDAQVCYSGNAKRNGEQGNPLTVVKGESTADTCAKIRGTCACVFQLVPPCRRRRHAV